MLGTLLTCGFAEAELRAGLVGNDPTVREHRADDLERRGLAPTNGFGEAVFRVLVGLDLEDRYDGFLDADAVDLVAAFPPCELEAIRGGVDDAVDAGGFLLTAEPVLGVLDLKLARPHGLEHKNDVGLLTFGR